MKPPVSAVTALVAATTISLIAGSPPLVHQTSLQATQDGLDVLAADTGGLFLHDTNDLEGALRRTLDDQRGYYLHGITLSPDGHSLVLPLVDSAGSNLMLVDGFQQ